MKLKDETEWKQYVDNNADLYGQACVQFAEAWADALEEAFGNGETIADCASRISHEVDRRFGITGFMYGMAVQILAVCWEYGEALREWHNLDVQIKDEGGHANEKGTVLNPAMLMIKEVKP